MSVDSTVYASQQCRVGCCNASAEAPRAPFPRSLHIGRDTLPYLMQYLPLGVQVHSTRRLPRYLEQEDSYPRARAATTTRVSTGDALQSRLISQQIKMPAALMQIGVTNVDMVRVQLVAATKYSVLLRHVTRTHACQSLA